MQEQKEFPTLSLDERVARLEGKLGWGDFKLVLTNRLFYCSAGMLVFSIILCLVGVGIPNHYYQFVLAALAVLLAYHRQWLAYPQKSYQWLLAVLNTAVLSMLFKLVIGGGHRQPFFWALYPVLKKEASSEDKSKWLEVVPDWILSWEPSALSNWAIDLTIIQTFLLLITLVGALVDFQPFISLTAFLLIVISLPALVTFDWPWVFPAIIATVVAFYLQSEAAREE